MDAECCGEVCATTENLSIARGIELTRRGVTAVELLALLGAGCIVASLWLPQIERWRESARKQQCLGNLRQIGIALQDYHGAHQALPPGYSPGGFKRLPKGGAEWPADTPSYCWAVWLLPFVGNNDLYAKLGVGQVSLVDAIRDPNRLMLLRNPLAIYRCPSDLAGDSFATAPIHPENRFLDKKMSRSDEIIAGGTSSYVGSGGYFSLNLPSALSAEAQYGRKPSLRANNGLFSVACSIRHSDITDGLANTFAVGERAYFQGSSTWVGVQNVNTEPSASICLGRVYWRINELPSEFWELPSPEFEFATPTKGFYVSRSESAKGGFSSYHLGGAHFLMADGSVRFLSNDIDFHNTIHLLGVNPTEPIPDIDTLGVFQRLGIRNDGLPIFD